MTSKTKNPHLSIVQFLKSQNHFSSPSPSNSEGAHYTDDPKILQAVIMTFAYSPQRRSRALYTLICRPLKNFKGIDTHLFNTIAKHDGHHGNTKPSPRRCGEGLVIVGSLAVTYFRTRDVHYHRRDFVSRSCSRWEGVGPKCYGRQA